MLNKRISRREALIKTGLATLAAMLFPAGLLGKGLDQVSHNIVGDLDWLLAKIRHEQFNENVPDHERVRMVIVPREMFDEVADEIEARFMFCDESLILATGYNNLILRGVCVVPGKTFKVVRAPGDMSLREMYERAI